MPATAPTVFLSAATIDLEEWRGVLHDVFEEAQLRPVAQNYNLGAPLHDVRDTLVRRIEQADCVIHLAGIGYGGDAFQPFPEMPDFRCSWTQFEYYYAHSLGKPVIGVVLAPDLSAASFTETGKDDADIQEKYRLQQAHRQRVASGKFDGTPLAAKHRTLNREAKTIHEFFRVIAAAIGELHLLGARGEKAAADLSLRLTRFQLPLPKPGFVGRTADLDALRALPAAAAASGAATALLTGLGGMGGIGKSELAKVLAQTWRPHYPDAQLWLDGFGTRISPPPPSAGDLIAQVLRAFHPQAGPLPDDLPTLETLLRQTLDGKKALIVLDNAASAAQAAPLHGNLPAGCGFLLTSRHEFLLGTQRPRRVGRLSAAESIDLLREYAPHLDDPAAAALAGYCAGLPLALRLAGAHLALEGDSPAAVATYLAKLKASRLGTLDADAPDAGEITIQETLRLSVDPLNAEDRAVWLRLGVFTGDWEAAAARAVAGDTADEACLTRLRRRNLLEDLAGEDGAPRHRLHDLAAEYAVKRLADEEGEAARSAAHLAHARHYTAVGDAADRLYLGGDPLGGLALFDRERVQIEAAFAWLSDPRGMNDGGKTGRAATDPILLALVNAVTYNGDLRFHPRLRITWLEAQAAAARRLGHRKMESNAYGNLGIAHRQLGDTRRAIGFSEKDVMIRRGIGDRRGEAAALGNLGNAHFQLGDARRAIGYYEQQLEIVREIGDRRGEGNALGNLGSAHADLGDPRLAIAYYDVQLDIAREFCDRRRESIALGNLGAAYADLSEASRAIEYSERALAIHREIGDRRSEGTALGNLGTSHADLGAPRRAIWYFAQQLEIAREISDQRGEGNALWNMALAHKSLGERNETLARAEAALTIYEAIEDPTAERVREMVEVWRG